MYETLRVDHEGPIATVTLLGATMAPRLFAECEQAFGALGADASLRVVVVRSEAKAFSYGLDLVAAFRELGPTLSGGGLAGPRTELLQLIRTLQRAFTAIAACPAPVIAAV